MVNQKVAARLQVGPNCLLFFIDETGHETFADNNYPVFGLGGCAINSSSAAAVIAESWCAMKAAHFGGEDVPLYANDLRDPTTEQLDALSKFFREQQFARPCGRSLRFEELVRPKDIGNSDPVLAGWN
jgi:Protein of unknown function (DUF3800)